MTGIEETAALGAVAEAGAAASGGALASGAGSTLAAAGSGLAASAGTAFTAATAPTLAGTLASISPYLTLGSTLISTIGSLASGNAQKNALQYNQAVDKINAGTALATSAADAQRSQIRSQREVASAQNQFGASGVNLGSGSPLDVLSDHAAQGALDSEIIRWRGDTQANAYLNNAQQAGYQADQASIAGDIQAGTTLLTQGARYATTLIPRQGSGTVAAALNGQTSSKSGASL